MRIQQEVERRKDKIVKEWDRKKLEIGLLNIEQVELGIFGE